MLQKEKVSRDNNRETATKRKNDDKKKERLQKQRTKNVPTFPIWKIGTLTKVGLDATISVKSASFGSVFAPFFITQDLQEYLPAYFLSIRLKVRSRLPNESSRSVGTPEIGFIRLG